MGSRTGQKVLGLALLTVGAGVAAGLAASAGAGPLGELPGHGADAVLASPRATALPALIPAAVLFPTAAPATPIVHSVYIQDPAPPPITVTPAPTP